MKTKIILENINELRIAYRSANAPGDTTPILNRNAVLALVLDPHGIGIKPKRVVLSGACDDFEFSMPIEVFIKEACAALELPKLVV